MDRKNAAIGEGKRNAAKAVKLSDIAKIRCQCSCSLSKALSGQKGMSDELRDRIVALADEMGYVKIVQNKEKEAGKSYNLGVIVAETISKRRNESHFIGTYIRKYRSVPLKKSALR